MVIFISKYWDMVVGMIEVKELPSNSIFLWLEAFIFIVIYLISYNSTRI